MNAIISKDHKFVITIETDTIAQPEIPDMGTKIYADYMLGDCDSGDPTKGLAKELFHGDENAMHAEFDKHSNVSDLFKSLEKIAEKQEKFIAPIDVYEHGIRQYLISTDSDWDMGVKGFAVYNPEKVKAFCKKRNEAYIPEYKNAENWRDTGLTYIISDANACELGNVKCLNVLDHENGDDVRDRIGGIYFDEDKTDFENIGQALSDLDLPILKTIDYFDIKNWRKAETIIKTTYAEA